MSICKCRACGFGMSTKKAYKVIVYTSTGRAINTYYCCQEEYEEYMAKKRGDKDGVCSEM